MRLGTPPWRLRQILWTLPVTIKYFVYKMRCYYKYTYLLNFMKKWVFFKISIKNRKRILCLARHVDKMINSDSILTTLCDKLSAGGGNMAGSGLSGLQDRDYPLASQTGSKTQICVRGSVRESIRRVWLLQKVYLVRFNKWKINQVDVIRLQWHNFLVLIFKYLPSFFKILSSRS